MPLTSEQKEKINSWLAFKKVKPACPSCGKDDWGFGEIISGNVVAGNGGIATGTQSPPMIQLGCLNCGYVRLFLVHKDMKLF
jgi:hypothetical protein